MLIDKRETLRYLGYGASAPQGEEDALINDCLTILGNSVTPRAVLLRVGLSFSENGTVTAGALEIKSKALFKALSGCESAFLFAATLGAAADTLIRRESAVSMAKAAILQAAGAAAIEQFCNEKCAELESGLASEKLYIRPRFSPGYGDFPLSHQPLLLNAVSAVKIGLSCTESLMLVPSKSVTAVIGISKTPCRAGAHCDACDKQDCEFRKDKL